MRNHYLKLESEREWEAGRDGDRDRAAAFNQWKRVMNSNQSHSMGWGESVCGLERSCVHIPHSLSGSLTPEMFVHNSGAGNAIHLFRGVEYYGI